MSWIFSQYYENYNYFDLCCEKESKNPSNTIKDKKTWELMFREMVISSKWESHNHFWHFWYNTILAEQNKRQIIQQQENKILLLNISPDIKENLWCFITIGFNEQTITIPKMIKISEKVSELKYFTECEYVLEKHRENGIHHHTHFLVKLDKKYHRSKLVGWIYQLKGLKDICLVKNHIDIKSPLFPSIDKPCPPFQVCYNYIRGIKREEKIPFVEMDDTWRNENKIEKLYKKLNI